MEPETYGYKIFSIFIYYIIITLRQKTLGFFPIICYHIVMEESIQKEEDGEKENSPKGVTPQEIQFYFKASWYLLALVLIFEFLMMYIISNSKLANGNIILWILRVIIFSYIFWQIGKKFKGLNLSLLGAILGLEVGVVVSVAKIILNGGAGWTWFNLFTEPFYMLGMGALVGLVFSSSNNKKKI